MVLERRRENSNPCMVERGSWRWRSRAASTCRTRSMGRMAGRGAAASATQTLCVLDICDGRGGEVRVQVTSASAQVSASTSAQVSASRSVHIKCATTHTGDADPARRSSCLRAVRSLATTSSRCDRSWASWRSIGSSGDFGPCRWIFRQNCVVDGDTIRYAGQKIRLADIDAPEISSPQCASEAALGQRAKERLIALINVGPFEIVSGGGTDTDRYGRRLRVIQRNGRSFGDILVAEGLARRWNGARRSWCG